MYKKGEGKILSTEGSPKNKKNKKKRSISSLNENGDYDNDMQYPKK